MYLKWHDENQKKSITKSFITGKTLGENGNDLDRMFLISSAITKVFHGDHATHARYMKIGGARGPHRSPAKRVRWGKEEQGSGRSFRHRRKRS